MRHFRSTIQAGRQGLARSEASSPPLSDAQTCPQTTRPLHHHERSVTRGLSARPTPDLDHP
jgi:hypothetical protein